MRRVIEIKTVPQTCERCHRGFASKVVAEALVNEDGVLALSVECWCSACAHDEGRRRQLEIQRAAAAGEEEKP